MSPNAVPHEPPFRTPWTVDSRGRLTSWPWIQFFANLVGTQVTVTGLTATDDGGFGDDAPRDTAPEAIAITSLLGGDADDGRDRPAIETLDRLTGAGDTPAPPYDDRDIRIILGASEVNRAGSEIRFVIDTHANRLANYPAAAFADGSRFFESDRTVTYVAIAGVWTYESGRCRSNQSTLPNDLGAGDVGFPAEVQDYAHTLEWSGAAWGWGAGDCQSDWFQDRGSAPTGNGWHACDGSTVNFLKADGTLGARTLPNSNASLAYRKSASSYSAVITAASAPTVTPTGSVSVSASGSFTGAPSGSENITQGSGTVTTAAPPFTPSGSIGISASGTFTGALDTTTLTGDPIANYQAAAWYRQ